MTLFNRVFRSRHYDPKDGDLVTVVTNDGQYGVGKILKVDGGGVHFRLYVQRFPTRPEFDELPELTLDAFGPGFDNPFSVGHMPLSFKAFEAWQPAFVAHGDVLSDELDGYQAWLEADAGYF